jgi:hypothetical protein
MGSVNGLGPVQQCRPGLGEVGTSPYSHTRGGDPTQRKHLHTKGKCAQRAAILPARAKRQLLRRAGKPLDRS